MDTPMTTREKFKRMAVWVLTNATFYYALQQWVYHDSSWGKGIFLAMYWIGVAANSLLCTAAIQQTDDKLREMADNLAKKGTSLPLPLSVLYDWFIVYTLVTTGHNLLAVGWAWQSACEITIYKRKGRKILEKNAH